MTFFKVRIPPKAHTSRFQLQEESEYMALPKGVSAQKRAVLPFKRAASSNHVSNEISFYRANEKPWGVLSNLYPRPILFEGRAYPSAEHAYQAGKARKPQVAEWLLSAPSPALVAMAAHGLYTWDIVPNWSVVKVSRMRDVLRAKFTQHEDLMMVLIQTGQARIVEAGRTDNLVNRTWGEVNGKGKNLLGNLLMEIREELKVGKSKGHKTAMSRRSVSNLLETDKEVRKFK
jgi:ribA/ribD-fused uncharacterized protein